MRCLSFGLLPLRNKQTHSGLDPLMFFQGYNFCPWTATFSPPPLTAAQTATPICSAIILGEYFWLLCERRGEKVIIHDWRERGVVLGKMPMDSSQYLINVIYTLHRYQFIKATDSYLSSLKQGSKQKQADTLNAYYEYYWQNNT